MFFWPVKVLASFIGVHAKKFVNVANGPSNGNGLIALAEDIKRIGELVTYATRLQRIASAVGAFFGQDLLASASGGPGGGALGRRA